MYAANLTKRAILVHRELIARAQVGLKRRRLREGAAGGAVGISDRCDRLSIHADQIGGVGLTAAVPRSCARQRQSMHDAGNELSLRPPDPVIRSVGGKDQIAETALRIEE